MYCVRCIFFFTAHVAASQVLMRSPLLIDKIIKPISYFRTGNIRTVGVDAAH